jgi:hypothetical protein
MEVKKRQYLASDFVFTLTLLCPICADDAVALQYFWRGVSAALALSSVSL